MALDYSTLGLISLVVAGLNSLLLVAAAVMWRHLPGPLWWALGGLANGLTAIGFTMPGGTVQPAIVAMTIAGTFGNLALTHRGIVLFAGRREGLTAVPVIAAGAAAACGALVLVVDRPALRALVFLAGAAVITGMVVRSLLRGARGRGRLPLHIVAFVYEATVALLLYRWAAAAFGDAFGPLATPGMRDAITMGTSIILSNLRLFGLGLMVAARLQDEAARYAEAMRRDARQDALTGLANRRALADAATAIHAEWTQGGRYAVIILDLDRFKAINDRFGHGGGDEALRTVAAFLATTARPQDLVARLGGEEFVLVLPGCTTAEAMAAAETLRRGMHRLTVVIAGQPIEVTASLGLALVGGEDHEFATVLDRADQALYAAKALGRDRVELAAGDARSQRQGGSMRRPGRLGGRDSQSMPMVLADSIRRFSVAPCAARRSADARPRR